MIRELGWSTAALMAISLVPPATWAQNATNAHMSGITINVNGSRLGIGVKDVTADRVKALKLKDQHGAEITMVDDNSPASRAGLKPGDVILELNGKALAGFEELKRVLGNIPAGSEVKLDVWRNGQAMTVTAVTERQTYVETPAGIIDLGGVSVAIPPIPPMPPMPSVNIDIPSILTMVHCSSLGADEETLQRDGQLAEFFGVHEGVLVRAVSHDSPAERAGIKAGDVITKIGDSKVATTRQVAAALSEVRPDRSVPVTVVRKQKEMSVSVTLEDPRRR